MTFGYSDIEAPIRMGIRKGTQSRSVNHSGRNSADGTIQLCFFLECFGKCLRISKGPRGSLQCGTSSNIIGSRTVESGRIGLSWPIARTLFGNHMYQNRNIRFQRMTNSPLQCGDIMAINRRRAYNSQLLEKHGVRHNKLLQRFFCRFAQFHHGLACRTKRVLHKILHVVTVFTVIARNTQCTQVHCHCANIACNTHFVVVQDDNERRLCLADIVERLECHTTSKRSIANKSHDLLIVAT